MIFDIEGDGLTPSKIHVLSYQKNGKIYHTNSYDKMREVLTGAKLLIGHNIILFDIPVLERILNIKITARLIDTLALSWYLNHTRIIHRLESYGEDYGVPKPIITDWENLSYEEYAHRCDEDVKITSKLWNQLKSKLLRLYEDRQEADRLIDYLMFKMDTVREQERSKWKLDVEKTQSLLDSLLLKQEEKLSQLTQIMPPVEIWATKKRPAKPFKKDGTYSVAGAYWFALLSQEGLPKDYHGEVKLLVGTSPANPNSTSQVKDWLTSLGWKPRAFKYVKDGDKERSIPQIRVDGEHGKELCPSVIELADEHPDIRVLEGLSILQHRIGILKGFLREQVDGYLKAKISGFTNTLRFKHKELVNLPGVDKPYGKEIRGALLAREGNLLCGSDMVSLESTTKRHYMYEYDPEYVEEMSKPGFDEHLDLAKHAGAVTQEEIDNWNKEVPNVVAKVKPIRKKFKATNYSAIYGIGKPKLSRELGISTRDAGDLLKQYWKRNWSVLEVVKSIPIKRFGGEMWLFNPVSRFWYSLRYEKDIFSTLNQGTGVYCFDTWIKHFRKVRPQITGQFHDEVVLEISESAKEKCTTLLTRAIEETNRELQLNVQLAVDTKYGRNYAEVH